MRNYMSLMLLVLIIMLPVNVFAYPDTYTTITTEEVSIDDFPTLIDSPNSIKDDYDRLFLDVNTKIKTLMNLKQYNSEHNNVTLWSEPQEQTIYSTLENMAIYVRSALKVMDSPTDYEWIEEQIDSIITLYEHTLLLIDDLDSTYVTTTSVEILDALEEGHASGLILKTPYLKERIESIGIASSRSLGNINPPRQLHVKDDKTIVEVNPASLVFDIQNTARKFAVIENRVNDYYGEENVRDLWFEIKISSERVTDTMVLPIQKEVMQSFGDTPVSRIGLETDGIMLAIHKLDLSKKSDSELQISFEDSKTLANLPDDAFIKGYAVDLKYSVDSVEQEVLIRPALISFNLDKFDFGDDVDINSLSIHRFNEETNSWEPVGGAYDPITNTLAVNRLNLSQYTIMRTNRFFSDISNSSAEVEIQSLLNKGVFEPESSFDPKALVTRRELASWISRAYGLVDPDATEPFVDVQDTDPSFSEIAAGFSAGILTSRSENQFSPDENVTREELALIVSNLLVNYEQKVLNDNLVTELDGISDIQTVSADKIDQFALMIELDLLQLENEILNPQGEVSREQVARLLEKILG